MARLPILNGLDVRMILTTKHGPVMDVDLLALYLINKYGGDDVLLSVHIPERVDEDTNETLPPIDYDIVIQERKVN